MADTYKFQLQQIELALKKDPENRELLSLKEKLSKLLELLSAEQKTGDNKSFVRSDTRKVECEWKVGSTVLARYPRDGKMYQAVVSALPEMSLPPSQRFYSVVYSDYGTSEKVKDYDIREYDPDLLKSKEDKKANKSKKQSIEVPKKKQNEPIEERYHEKRQQNWQSFAQGVKRKSASNISSPAPKRAKESRND